MIASGRAQYLVALFYRFVWRPNSKSGLFCFQISTSIILQMSISEEKALEKNSKRAATEKFVEGADFYFENGLMVLTAHFLKKRGFCCGNDCRHCPYPKNENQSQEKSL